ncbi:MAG TPA: FAD/NAD(P)-binding protein, partial [Kofleriaceae bacterium]
GTMTAAQLVRRAGEQGRALRVLVFDRAAAFAAGVAYRTVDDRHLLNVPAGKMSAWPDRPDSFLDWARAQLGAQVADGDFLPRLQFGAYLRDQLRAAPGGSIELVPDDVLGVAARGPGFTVQLAGSAIDVDAAVLAIGHRQPSDPLADRWHGPRDRFLADPWPSLDPAVIATGDPVVILGSGLTAVDAWLTLTRTPRTAPITLVSRHGLLPRVHASAPVAPIALDALGLPAHPTLRALTAAVHRALLDAPDWRVVIDGLRPHSARLWAGLSRSDQAAFLRHVRPLWEVHRHRMAPSIAALVDEQLRTGALRILAGKVRTVTASATHARLTIALRTGGEVQLSAGHVINCTGPGHHQAQLPAPLPAMIAAGLLEPDPLGLGVLTGPAHEALAAGSPRPGLYVLGTLCKPRLWESTAVPELRAQAETVARQVLGALG